MTVFDHTPELCQEVKPDMFVMKRLTIIQRYFRLVDAYTTIVKKEAVQ